MSLRELQTKRERLVQELGEVDTAISCDRTKIRDFFTTEGADDLIGQIDWMREGEETISIRGEMCETVTWKFKDEDQEYVYRNGSGTQEILEVEGAKCEQMSFTWLYETWEFYVARHGQGAKTDALTLEKVLEKPRHKAVAFLLRWAESW